MMITMGLIEKKASLVVRLTDQFTNRAVTNASIRLMGYPDQAVNKKDGYYLFINLPEDQYQLSIFAPDYLPVTNQIQVGGTQKLTLLDLALSHAVTTSLLENTTRILGLVENHNQPLINTDIRLALISPGTQMRLIEQGEIGATTLKIYGNSALQGYKLEGKELLLLPPVKAAKKNKGTEVHIVKITQYIPKDDCYLLKSPLVHQYPGGTICYQPWSTTTDSRGSFILPIAPACFNGDDIIELGLLVPDKDMSIISGKLYYSQIRPISGQLQQLTILID